MEHQGTCFVPKWQKDIDERHSNKRHNWFALLLFKNLDYLKSVMTMLQRVFHHKTKSVYSTEETNTAVLSSQIIV